jgi:hypothetical protein
MDRTDRLAPPMAQLRTAGQDARLLIAVEWNIMRGNMDGIPRADNAELRVCVLSQLAARARAACSQRT